MSHIAVIESEAAHLKRLTNKQTHIVIINCIPSKFIYFLWYSDKKLPLVQPSTVLYRNYYKLVFTPKRGEKGRKFKVSYKLSLHYYNVILWDILYTKLQAF